MCFMRNETGHLPKQGPGSLDKNFFHFFCLLLPSPSPNCVDHQNHPDFCIINPTEHTHICSDLQSPH